MQNKDKYPKIIGGIQYKSQEELEARIKSDARQLAELIYDIYIEQKQSGKKTKPATK